MVACGTMRRKRVPTNTNTKVRIARSRSKSEVLSGKARDDNAAKKRALKPNADRGNAVAVPRDCGQFRAAVSQSIIENGSEALILTCLDRPCKSRATPNACHEHIKTQPRHRY